MEFSDIPDDRKINVDDTTRAHANMYMEFIGGIPTLHAFGKRHGLVPIKAAVEQFFILKKRGFNPMLLYGERDGKLWGLGMGSPVIAVCEDNVHEYFAQHPDIQPELLPGN